MTKRTKTVQFISDDDHFSYFYIRRKCPTKLLLKRMRLKSVTHASLFSHRTYQICLFYVHVKCLRLSFLIFTLYIKDYQLQYKTKTGRTISWEKKYLFSWKPEHILCTLTQESRQTVLKWNRYVFSTFKVVFFCESGRSLKKKNPESPLLNWIVQHYLPIFGLLGETTAVFWPSASPHLHLQLDPLPPPPFPPTTSPPSPVLQLSTPCWLGYK